MSQPKVVINASPLIFLSRADLLPLLKIMGDSIVVPEPVVQEINLRGPTDPTVKALKATEWLKIKSSPVIDESIIAWDLGRGESSVIAEAKSLKGTVAILDDLAARRCAAVFSIPVVGTLGIVLAAKRQGLIPLARPIVEHLRSIGMYLSDAIINQALTLVDE